MSKNAELLLVFLIGALGGSGVACIYFALAAH